MTNEELVT